MPSYFSKLSHRHIRQRIDDEAHALIVQVIGFVAARVVVTVPQECRIGDHESVDPEAPEIHMIAEVDPLHGGRRGELGTGDLAEKFCMILIFVRKSGGRKIGHRGDEVTLRRIEKLEDRRRVFLYLLIGKVADHLDARHAGDVAAGRSDPFREAVTAHILRAEKGRFLQRKGDEDKRVKWFPVLRSDQPGRFDQPRDAGSIIVRAGQVGIRVVMPADDEDGIRFAGEFRVDIFILFAVHAVFLQLDFEATFGKFFLNVFRCARERGFLLVASSADRVCEEPDRGFQFSRIGAFRQQQLLRKAVRCQEEKKKNGFHSKIPTIEKNYEWTGIMYKAGKPLSSDYSFVKKSPYPYLSARGGSGQALFKGE